ncbi:hypothetical protein HNV08_01940 [Winogradskyella eckloniae]|uniref:hypothetical protein n=1 Tax=Winogradskyella eckloniae TaxID=1089306 RepID=UPI0015672984|nr:hypothetical protein [Winogradskyella eckloniae]NRD18794.1 hypothetical protein [Winogradskyella eckloniae]
METKLKYQWTQLSSKYTEDKQIIAASWHDIETHYSSKNRYYHNLAHLHHMFILLDQVKTEIEALDQLKFAIWYHDIIYSSTKNNNEEKSANFAEKALKSFDIDAFSIKT